MERVVVKHRSFEEAERADREWYRQLTPERRVEILLKLIELGRQESDAARQGLARTYRVVKLSEC